MLNVFDLSSIITGSAQPQITRQSLKPVPLRYPSLNEQEQIVAVLNQAIQAIDTATQNNRKNLANCDELFQSQLRQSLKPDKNAESSWAHTTLGDTCEMYQPKNISKKDFVEDGTYPVYGANGIIGRYNQFNHSGPQLLLTCRGATCGTVNKTNEKCWITGNAMVVRPRGPEISLDYLAYYLATVANLSAFITGAAQPQLTRTSLARVQLLIPPLTVQKQLVSHFDKLNLEIEAMKSVYQMKLEATAALRQSILTRAFSGHLKVR